MTRFRFLWVLYLIIILGIPNHAQDTQIKLGDRGIAEKYIVWAKAAIAEGHWTKAIVGLERGADFSAVSSDIAYLLALARFHEKQPAMAVLEAVRYALAINQWSIYTPVSGRILEAEILVQIRNYSGALRILSELPPGIDEACLRLRSLKGIGDREGFTKVLAEAMEAYPWDPYPVRIFFEYAADRLPVGNEGELMSLALRRLPLLIEADRDLSYLAVPFISDTDEARRILAAYRAIHPGVPASIPGALNLGLIEGKDVIDELFRHSPGTVEKKLDKNLLLSVWNLLRDNTEREYFRKQVLDFSGVITEDADRDGFAEYQVRYEHGIITRYSYDADQDGFLELTILFEGGVPVRAEFVLTKDSTGAGNISPVAYPPVKDDERIQGVLQWEQYPGVRETRLDGVVYTPKPFAFFFFPIYFKKLESGGLLYPERDPLKASMTYQTLITSSLFIERLSREFSGAIEKIELNQGIPQKSYEFLNGRLVSETTFYLGKPVMQRIDLDLNGYLETTRHFRGAGNPSFYVAGPGKEHPLDFESIIEFYENDWDEDGVFEYAERYIYEDSEFLDYRVLHSWDRDGVREFSNQIRYVKK